MTSCLAFDIVVRANKQSVPKARPHLSARNFSIYKGFVTVHRLTVPSIDGASFYRLQKPADGSFKPQMFIAAA